jgi:hypothetical protein
MDSLSDARVRDHFIGWQCRIRQFAMRQDGGRPSPGMRPKVYTADGSVLSEGLIVLLVPHDTAEHTAFFRFQVQKTNDPRTTYEKGLAYLQGTYFQRPQLFSDELTALFPRASVLSAAMLAAGEVLLEFDQFSQTFKMMCAVRKLAANDPARALTIWHNRMFNPLTPSRAIVLGLRPNWRNAQAHPGP